MPPKPKTALQIEEEKSKIALEALNIISDNGVQALTMRTLSKKLDMSASNIYHYFYNKDEIYIYILLTGFRMLAVCQSKAADHSDIPYENLKVFINTFIRFGVENSSYYQVMFGSKRPRYNDYNNERFKEYEQAEKDFAMKVFLYLCELIRQCKPNLSKDEINTISSRIICEIHGFISLNFTNVLGEISSSKELVIDNLVQHILKEFN